jgi:single-strand DNA-binding protein
MNTVTLIGNLTKDPEMMGSGETKVCRLRLAESTGSKDAKPLYIDVAAFGRQAETCQRYLTKGRPVAVSGRLRFREWEAEGGAKRSAHSIAADRVQFLSSGRRDRAESGEEAEPVPTF